MQVDLEEDLEEASAAEIAALEAEEEVLEEDLEEEKPSLLKARLLDLPERLLGFKHIVSQYI